MVVCWLLVDVLEFIFVWLIIYVIGLCCYCRFVLFLVFLIFVLGFVLFDNVVVRVVFYCFFVLYKGEC